MANKEDTPKKGLFGMKGFGKKSGDAKADKSSSKKGKGKAKQPSILATLDDVVPVSVVDELSDFSKSYDGVVRELNNDGYVAYTVIAIKEMELADKGGDLLLSIRGDGIRSAYRKEDNDFFVMIPTETTITSLREYFDDDTVFHWGLFYADVSQFTSTQIIDAPTVTLAELVRMANNELAIPFGDEPQAHEAATEPESPQQAYVEPSYDVVPASYDEPSYDVAPMDVPGGFDAGGMDAPVGFDEPAMFGVEPFGMPSDDMVSFGDVEEAPTSEYAKLLEPTTVSVQPSEHTDEVSSIRRFFNGEYAVDIESEFESCFPVTPTLFTITEREGGTLDQYLNELRVHHNDRIMRLRTQHITVLKRMYNDKMTEHAVTLQQHLSDTELFDESNEKARKYYDRRQMIEAEYSDKQANLDTLIANERAKLDEEYQQRLQAHINHVAQQAAREFDEKFEPSHSAAKEAVTHHVRTSVDAEYTRELTKLTNERQMVATLTMQTIQNDILSQLQDTWQLMMDEERALYETLDAELRAKLDANAKSDINRVEVLRAAMQQESMAQRVRKEQQDIIDNLESMLAETKRRHIQELERAQKEYDNLVNNLQGSSVDLRAEVERLRNEAMQARNEASMATARAKEEQADTLNRLRENLEDYRQRDLTKSKKDLYRYIAIGSITFLLGATGSMAVLNVVGDDEREAVTPVVQPAASTPTIINVPTTTPVPATGANTAIAERDGVEMEAYVATSQISTESLLVEYKDTYATGDVLRVLGVLSGTRDATDMTVTVEHVDGDTVFVKAGNEQYSFVTME